MPRRALRRRARNWPGSGSRRAGLDWTDGRDSASLRRFSAVDFPKSFPLPRCGRRRGEVSRSRGPGGGAGDGGRRTFGAPRRVPRRPGRRFLLARPPELPAFRAARRCGCEMLAQPEVEPWPLVFCSPSKILTWEGRAEAACVCGVSGFSSHEEVLHQQPFSVP